MNFGLRTVPRGLPVYLLAFLIPFTVRLIPELLNPYLLGPDTAWYVFKGNQLAVYPSSEWRIFNLFLGGLSLAGINLEAFMKIYPSVNFGLITFLLCLYAKKVFGYSPLNLLVASFALSVFPAFLRMSLDLHRENFAMIFLVLTLLVDGKQVSRRQCLILSFLMLLIGLGHEFVLGIGLVIMGYQALTEAFRRDWRSSGVHTAIALIPLATYVVAVFLVSGRIPNFLSSLIVTEYRPFLWGVDYRVSGPVDWWLSVLVLSVGFFMPMSVLGFFHDSNLSPWLALTFSGYASFLVSPVASFRYPERWLLLASFPLALYTANFLRKQNSFRIIILLSILSLQGLSMVGVFQSPLSFYGGQRYGAMIDILSTPESPEAIESLYSVASYLRNNSVGRFLLIVPFELQAYAQYLLGLNVTVLSQDNLRVRGFLEAFLNGSETSSIYHIAYVDRPQYQLPFLNNGIRLEPVYMLHPLVLYRTVRISES